MKKVICLLCVLVIFLCGCTQTNQAVGKADYPKTENGNSSSLSEVEKTFFTKSENGNLVSASGVKYEYLAYESSLCYLGELEFVGSVQGEEKTFQHLGSVFQTGMFAVKEAENDNILIRYEPDNEWLSIYRKVSLPEFDFSADNCIRLEYVSGSGNAEEDSVHTTCKGGISDKTEIAKFLSDVRLQQNPRDAGLYDLVKNPDGILENCYVCGVIYGFFEEEPELVIRMDVTSFNDLAYSVSVEEREYVLPETWMQKLMNN